MSSKKRFLEQYRGALTSVEIASGMNAATRNAKRLAQDAESMLKNSRFSSAVGLAALSIEESGKHTILRELALARNQAELNAAWRDYRRHTSKNQLWILIDSALRGASKLRDFAHLFDPDSDHPEVLDKLKQVSFYTDCPANRHWSIPEEVIDQPIAEMLVQVAHVLSQSREVSGEEIDLWIFHMQPVYKTTTEAMENALIAWDRDMRARGLLTDGSPTMEAFVQQGINIRRR